MMKPVKFFAIVAAALSLAVNSMPLHASDADDQIEKTAENLYVFKTHLKGDNVKIESKDGVVTLSGSVSEESRRVLAEESVASLGGVTSVNNKLKIKDEPAENSDGWIAARVKTVLFFHRSVSGIKTDVAVKNGVVTLGGEAANQAQKDLTTEYAKDVDGVKDVKNQMTVGKGAKPDSKSVGDKIDDASITSQVKVALLFHRSTRVLKTHVKTDNGAVTLTGTAGSAAEKDLVTKLVEDINGVAKVHNKMTVAEKGK